jgi:hypothetical protein
MIFNEGMRLSARVFGRVLNYPLYDGDCSPAAREYLAAGNVAGAIAEWQRLADLGSGRARCVLSYLHLMGAPTIPVDLEEARRLALSAITGERGYANYLLACIAFREKRGPEGLKYLMESHKAGFAPASTSLAAIVMKGASADQKRNAIRMLRQAAAAGHWPARLRLVGFYLSGQQGFFKRALGLALLLPAFITLSLGLRYQVFSVHCFQYMANAKQSLFNDESIRSMQKSGSLAAGEPYVWIVRWTHALAATMAVGVLVRQSGSISSARGTISAGAIVGLALLAVWPYGLSYLVASTVNARRLVSALVESILLCLITTLVCSAYLGHLFDSPLSAWGVAETTVAQALLLLVACGLGENAAAQVEANGPIPPYRHPIAWAHLILGLVAAGSCLLQPKFWRLDYWSDYGFNLASYSLLATLPYLTGAVLSWRLVTANQWKPWAYVFILIVGTALAVLNNTEIWMMQPGYLGVVLVLIVQFIGFVLAAEWALDGTEW